MANLSAQVIRRAQAGDEAALNQVVTSQQNYVYSICMGVFGNPEEAADMTQEAFIHLFRVLPTFRGDTRFTTWLYRVVKNLCYDELRRRRRQPQQASEEALSFLPETAPWSDPERVVTREETQERVRAALGQLEDHYRLALTLYYFQGLKYREIAEVTGLPMNTVKSHIYRGKARMAELLSEPADVETDAPSTPAASSGGRPDSPVSPESRVALVTGPTR